MKKYNHVIYVRIDENDYNELKEKAAECGLKLSDYVRKRLFGGAMITKKDRLNLDRLIYEINKIGVKALKLRSAIMIFWNFVSILKKDSRLFLMIFCLRFLLTKNSSKGKIIRQRNHEGASCGEEKKQRNENMKNILINIIKNMWGRIKRPLLFFMQRIGRLFP